MTSPNTPFDASMDSASRKGALRSRGALVVAAALLGLFAVAALASATGRTPFTGGDSSTLPVANQGLSFDAQPQVRGELAIVVTGFFADEIQTAVEMRVDGLPQDLSLTPRGLPFLVDSGGMRHPATHGGSDASDRTAITMTFPPLTEGAHKVTVVVPGFEPVQLDGRAASLGASDTEIAQDWLFSIAWEPPEESAVERYEVALSAPFGPATILVEEVVRSSSAIEIRGRIVGLTRNEFESVMIVPASIENEAGEVVGQVFGTQEDDGESFSLRFPAIGGKSINLTVPFNRAPSSNHDVGALVDDFGSKAAVSLQLDGTRAE